METFGFNTTMPSCDLSAMVASILSFGNSSNANLTPALGHSSRELMGNPCSLADLTGLTYMSEIDNRRTAPLNIDSFCNQSPPSYKEAKPTWSNEGSVLTSFEQLPNMYSTKANETVRNFTDSTYSSMFSGETLVDGGKATEVRSGKMNDSLHSSESFLGTDCELSEIVNSISRFSDDLFKMDDFATDLASSYAVDDLCQVFNVFSPDHSINRMGATLDNNVLRSTGATPVSSGMMKCELSSDIPMKHQSNSMQSSISDAFMSDQQEKSQAFHGIDNDLFDGLGDYIKPVTSIGHSTISTGISECITQLNGGSTAGPKKGLFSELGLEELLNGLSGSTSAIKHNPEDQLSATKRRKIDGSSSNSDHVPLTNLSSSAGSTSLLQSVYSQEINNLLCKKDVLPKSQVGLWIDDSYSINAENAAATTPKKPEKPVKVSRKRARPGESTRPRPKDRQQIQDRLKELRGIIPNGVKVYIYLIGTIFIQCQSNIAVWDTNAVLFCLYNSVALMVCWISLSNTCFSCKA